MSSEDTGTGKFRPLPTLVPMPGKQATPPGEDALLYEVLRSMERWEERWEEREAQTNKALAEMRSEVKRLTDQESERRGSSRVIAGLSGAALSLALTVFGAGIWMYVQVHLLDREINDHRAIAMHDGTRLAMEQRDHAISELNVQIARLTEATNQLKDALDVQNAAIERLRDRR